MKASGPSGVNHEQIINILKNDLQLRDCKEIRFIPHNN